MRFFFTVSLVAQVLEPLVQLFLELVGVDLFLQLLDPVLQSLGAGVGFAAGSARRPVRNCREQRFEGALLPLVKGLPRDAQLLGCLGGCQLARADLKDERDSLVEAVHLGRLCQRLRWWGKLDLLQAFGQPLRLRGAFLEQQLETGAQRFAPGQVDPGLQCLKHPLHGPALPVVEGHARDEARPSSRCLTLARALAR